MTEADERISARFSYPELTTDPDETDRLGLLHDVYDPASIRALSALDVQPHWRCLDAGCGRGTIAAWLARQAHQGLTVACDLDPGLISVEPSAVLQTVACDIGEAEFAPGSFDLIHARLLLQHLGNRESVLDRMVGWLAPGGRLVVADGFDVAASSTAHPEYAAFFAGFWRMLAEHTSTRPDWGRSYPEPLLRRGLTDIRVDVVTQPVHGGEPYALMLHQGIARLRPVVSVREGIGEPALDAVLANLRDPGFWELGFALVIASGRKPVIGFRPA